MDANKRWFLDSGGYNSYVSAWLTQGTSDGGTPPSSTVLSALSVFMNSLDVYGLGPSGSRMKTFNILHCGSKHFSKLNIKNPATYKFVESGTVTFTEGQGCKSASSSYFDQPFNSDEFAGIENALTAITYISETGTNTGLVAHGVRTTAVRIFALTPLSSASNHTIYLYTAAGTFAADNQIKGLYIMTRQTTPANTGALFKDGTKYSAVLSAAVPTYLGMHRYVLAYNNNNGVTPSAAGFLTKYTALDALYDAPWTDTDAANFKTAFDAYKTAVSLP